MPLLNPPDILPEATRFLLRAVIAHRAGKCGKAELLALVAPDGLVEAMKPLASGGEEDPDGENTAASGRRIAERSLAVLVSLGFVAVDGADIVLTDHTRSHWRTVKEVTAASFSRVLRSRIWTLAASDEEPGLDSRVRDLVDALAILFAEPDPLRPFEFESGLGRRFDAAQTKWFGPNKRDWPVTNTTQFPPLCRWAPYLGLAHPTNANSLVPDASGALLQDLHGLPTQRMRAGQFVARCAEVLPISDGGRRSLWKSEGGQELSPGLSMSMRQLEAAGHLTLPPPESDTDVVVIALGAGGDSVRVSHIDWHPRGYRKEPA